MGVPQPVAAFVSNVTHNDTIECQCMLILYFRLYGPLVVSIQQKTAEQCLEFKVRVTRANIDGRQLRPTVWADPSVVTANVGPCVVGLRGKIIVMR